MPIDLNRTAQHARNVYDWAKSQQTESGPHAAALGRLQAMASICEGVAGVAGEMLKVLNDLETYFATGELSEFAALRERMRDVTAKAE